MNRSLPTYDAAESRNKLSHFTVQGFDLNGVVQAGANDGEEIENFIRMGVEHLIAFEPHPLAFAKLEALYGDKAKCFQIALDNYDGTGVLQVAAGDGKSSSFFDLVDPIPGYVTQDVEVRTRRFDTWIEEHTEIDISLYDTLQLDTQGNEMDILLGMGEYLLGFKYLCIELSETPIYIGEMPGGVVAGWLERNGFILDSPIYSHNDAFFIRKDIKSFSDRVYLGRA